MDCRKALFRTIATLALAASLSACAATVSAPVERHEAGASAALLADIHAGLNDAAEQGFSGAVFLAANDKVILAEGVGHLAGKAIAFDDRFYVASITKQFTGAAILKLRDAGRLAMNDPIGRYLPELPVDKRAISIRELADHFSGLPQDYVADGKQTQSEALSAIGAQNLISAPGEKFGYSNDNYQLLAMIVERVSGLGWQDYVREHLLRPAGMSDTGFWADAGAAAVLPTAGDIDPANLTAHWGQIGSGGMYSTAGDLGRWYRALRHGRVLSEASARELLRPATPLSATTQTRTGFGWFLTPGNGAEPVVWSRGNESFGANGLIYTYKDGGLVLIILSHAGEASDGNLWSRALLSRIEPLLLQASQSGTALDRHAPLAPLSHTASRD